MASFLVSLRCSAGLVSLPRLVLPRPLRFAVGRRWTMFPQDPPTHSRYPEGVAASLTSRPFMASRLQSSPPQPIIAPRLGLTVTAADLLPLAMSNTFSTSPKPL